MKYIIELDEIPNTGLFKARGTNTLVFDSKGIENILKPYKEKPEIDWSQEHPRKTMLQDFLEKYPYAKLRNDGTPEGICPDILGYEDGESWCDRKCVKCWNRPLEEYTNIISHF